MDPRPLTALPLRISAASDFGLIELKTAGDLRVQLLPNGAVYALRHRETLINQFLPGPADNGLFRLLLRWCDAGTAPQGWADLVRPGLQFAHAGTGAATWQTNLPNGLHCTTVMQLHPTLSAWRWRVVIRNDSGSPLRLDVMHAQDIGLADEGAVRNNESYTSQYIDLLPHRDETFGWTVLARQNQAMTEGRRPWLALACTNGATAFCTDGWQFFGADHRLTNEPAAARMSALPSTRLQYEFALGGLQSRLVTVAPGATTEIGFLARFVEDHPTASAPADLSLLHELRATDWGTTASGSATVPAPSSLFQRAPWVHGEAPFSADWDVWFTGSRRHEERGSDGRLLSFFHGAGTHVVSREKEATVARPHGHVLRSGDGLWFDAGHFGLTSYAAGIFAAQAYLGHPSFARLLSVVRNGLNVTRSCGQRVFLRRPGDEWRQLGIPSAFAMTPSAVRWIYRLGAQVIEVQVKCARDCAAACLELRVLEGAPCEFLVTHEVVLGSTEFEHPGELEVWAEAGWMGGRPHPESLVGRHQPDVAFAIAASDPAQLAGIGGDGLLYFDGQERRGPYAVLRTVPIIHGGVILLGTLDGLAALPAAVAAARAEFARAAEPASPPPAPLRLSGGRDSGASRIDEILPWFAHNASIHFSAPHGLEQYGGAAWGVRDVCQGSVEWLLAAGKTGVVRRILEVVFAQQYPHDGGWPQWFMFPPYRFCQQAHSHGDVCFWPVKALCDYVEASNDFAFLQARLLYTDAEKFTPCGPDETILQHCDRVIAQCESRFIAGTALVNYGDGDWDDTLQPAVPELRTRMVSAWTVGLAFNTFRQLGEVCRRAGEDARAARLEGLCGRMRQDFVARLMPDGVVAGFLVMENDGTARPLLHPTDSVTRIRYRLLPMTRAIIAGLFTPEEATRHLAIVAKELLFPDGVRLMSEPSSYRGGLERLFKRAETAANVGREIGLQYVHAHLRYAEALARVGDAEGLFHALQVVNPVALSAVVANAAPRQSNVYFSSSDADFADRYEAEKRWSELKTGQVAVKGGWRLYSSGPGLFLHKVRACLLGIRESFDDVIFDPVLSRTLDGLQAEVVLSGLLATITYHVKHAAHTPSSIVINGVRAEARPESNPYRKGGLAVSRVHLDNLLNSSNNRIEIEL